MNQIEELTRKIQRDLYSKNNPGSVILSLREKWLEIFTQSYNVNIDALMLGFMLADFKLQESIDLRKQTDHIRMALDYANQAFERYSEIPKDLQEIVIEIIATHHGGSQNYTESKLFKNAVAMSMLEPKGWIHQFSLIYDGKDDDSFQFAIKKIDEKFEEMFLLVDLDENTINEANLLKEKYAWFRKRLL